MESRINCLKFTVCISKQIECYLTVTRDYVLPNTIWDIQFLYAGTSLYYSSQVSARRSLSKVKATKILL